MSDLIIVYSTHPTHSHAEKIAVSLLEKRMIACANIFPAHESLYWWDNKIAKEKEVIMIAKTVSVLFEQIIEEISVLHVYEEPCILAISIKSNEVYEQYIRKTINF